MGVLRKLHYENLSKNEKCWLAGIVLLLLALAAAWWFLPVNTWLSASQTWLKSLGAWGVALFLLIYIVGVVVLVPGSIMSIAAGLLYGFWGIPLAVIGATVGASIAFLIARYLAHDRMDSWIEGRRRVKAVMRAVDEGGWKIVGLVRLSPVIPFNLQNYFFGLTRVSFWGYTAATLVGIIPGVVVNIYLGTVGDIALDESEEANVRWGFFTIGLVVTLIVTWLIARKAKEKLAEAGVEMGESDETGKASAAQKS